MTEEPYGAKGCRCWPDELDVSTGLDGFITRVPGRWMPNASCQFHGLLAGLLAPRTDTGVYRVVRADDGTPTELEPMEPTPDLEDLLRRGVEQAERATPAIEGPNGWSMDATPHVAVTTEKEHGDLSTVRRWLRRLGDWLNPHAAADRDYRRLLADWRRERPHLDGGEPRDQGWER